MYAAKAYELRDHASERERLQIAAGYYANVLGDLPKATEAYTQLATSYPRDGRVRKTSGTFYGQRGQYEQAAELVRLAITQRPDLNIYFGNLANYLMAQQRLDEARNTITQAHEHKLDDFVLRLALYGLDFLKSDEAGMNTQLQWLANRPEAASFSFSVSADTAAYRGRLRQARELTTRGADASLRADSKEYAGIDTELAAIREAAYGNRAQGRQDAEAGLKLTPESQAVRSLAGIALAMSGDAARASAIGEELNRQSPADTQIQSLWLPAMRAQLALERKSPSAAIDELRAGGAARDSSTGRLPMLPTCPACTTPISGGKPIWPRGRGRRLRRSFRRSWTTAELSGICWTGSARAPWRCPGKCA